MFNVLLLYFIDPFIICHNARPDMKSSYAPKFQDTRTDVFSLHLTKDIRIFFLDRLVSINQGHCSS